MLEATPQPNPLQRDSVNYDSGGTYNSQAVFVIAAASSIAP